MRSETLEAFDLWIQQVNNALDIALVDQDYTLQMVRNAGRELLEELSKEKGE